MLDALHETKTKAMDFHKSVAESKILVQSPNNYNTKLLMRIFSTITRTRAEKLIYHPSPLPSFSRMRPEKVFYVPNVLKIRIQ